MDNQRDVQTSKRTKSSSHEKVSTFIAFVSLLECFEVWGCGWTLLTLLSPEEFPNLWKSNDTAFEDKAQMFFDITHREQYANCVIAYLAFYILFLLSSLSLMWGNWSVKVTPFLVYQGCCALSLLLTVVVSTYFLVQEHENVFLFVPNPQAELRLYVPYLLLFLYYSRYLYLGWILKIAFLLCSGQRRREIESEKDVDVQIEVDRAFQDVFENETTKDVRKGGGGHSRHMEHYGEPEESMYERPPSVPDFVQKIPRIRLSRADDDVPSSNGYVNGGFRANQAGRQPSPDDAGPIPSRTQTRCDVEQRESDNVVYMKRNANRSPADYAVVDLRRQHRRSRSDGLSADLRDGAYLNQGYRRDDERLPDPPVELQKYPQSNDVDDVARNRPRSTYSLRDSSFAYGPGPRGYNVPPPPSAGIEGAGVPLTREESLVRRLSARYDENAALRTGPAPTGGVPAIGPASIRRYPPRAQAAGRYQ